MALFAAKCVSRKCRCTYIKFHRQTAPIGPGHQPPRTSSSTSPIMNTHRSHLDDLFLGPPPTTVPSMSISHPMLSSHFSFNSAYPPSSTSELPPISAAIACDDLDVKYRTDTDLARRISLPTSTGPNVFPGICTSQSQPTQSWYPWVEGASGSASLFDSSRYLPPLDDKDYQTGVTRTQLPSAVSDAFEPDFYDPNGIGSAYRSRRPSFDFSDSSSASQSVPSSATSSNVHLPLPGAGEVFDHSSDDVHSQQSHAIPSSQPSVYPVSGPQRTEGGFSNAFGHLTIEDQNALAHLSPDGVPFFSNIGMGIPQSPNATPMPARSSSQSQSAAHYRDRGMSLSVLQTPGAELRDAWRAYVRTPLGAPGPIGLDGPTPNATSANSQNQLQMPTSPSGQRRRPRVSSLPSATPTTERAYPPLHGFGAGQADGPRASLHGNLDDLRSYEEAVNARNASLNFNLVPRRRGTRPPTSNGSPAPPSSASNGVSGTLGAGEVGLIASRPSSASSASSLAHAFGPPQGLVKPPPLSGASISLPVPSVHGLSGGSFADLPRSLPSRESSVGSDGTGSSDGEALRPSFKRLASQTLGPANSKRALVERGARGAGKTTSLAVPDQNGVHTGTAS